MAMNLAQDWRLHRRCDQQLAELGLGVDSELDIARRDVYGAATNLCEWRVARHRGSAAALAPDSASTQCDGTWGSVAVESAEEGTAASDGNR